MPAIVPVNVRAELVRVNVPATVPLTFASGEEMVRLREPAEIAITVWEERDSARGGVVVGRAPLPHGRDLWKVDHNEMPVAFLLLSQ